MLIKGAIKVDYMAKKKVGHSGRERTLTFFFHGLKRVNESKKCFCFVLHQRLELNPRNLLHHLLFLFFLFFVEIFVDLELLIGKPTPSIRLHLNCLKDSVLIKSKI
jgi:hypothetical protein